MPYRGTDTRSCLCRGGSTADAKPDLVQWALDYAKNFIEDKLKRPSAEDLLVEEDIKLLPKVIAFPLKTPHTLDRPAKLEGAGTTSCRSTSNLQLHNPVQALQTASFTVLSLQHYAAQELPHDTLSFAGAAAAMAYSILALALTSKVVPECVDGRRMSMQHGRIPVVPLLRLSLVVQLQPRIAYLIMAVNVGVYAAGLVSGLIDGNDAQQDYFLALAKTDAGVEAGEYYR